MNHPLEPNQMYANLSIDITETQIGILVKGQQVPRTIILKCTVSADIIEYSAAARSSYTPSSNVGSLEQLVREEGEYRIGDIVAYTFFTMPVKAEVLNVQPEKLYIKYQNKGKYQNVWTSIKYIDVWKDE
jgi:hypothetical protein